MSSDQLSESAMEEEIIQGSTISDNQTNEMSEQAVVATEEDDTQAVAANFVESADDLSPFKLNTDEKAEFLTRQIFVDGYKSGEDTNCYKLVLPKVNEGEPPIAPGSFIKQIDGQYDVQIPMNFKYAQSGQTVYLMVPKRLAGNMTSNTFDATTLDPDDEIFEDDCGLPGSDATMMNWFKRGLTKTVKTLTFGYVTSIPGYHQIGTRDPQSGHWLPGQKPWEVDETYPKPHISSALAKVRRNQLHVRRVVTHDEYYQQLTHQDSKKPGCVGCKEAVHVDLPHRGEEGFEESNIKHRAGTTVPYSMAEPIPFYKFPGMKLFCPKQFANQVSLL